MSAFNEFNKIFKHAISGVDAVAKYMDEKFEPYSESVIDAVNEFNGVVIISTDDDKKRFKELLAEKFKIFFEENTLRISKPKLDGNKRPTTAYASFVRAERKRIMEEYGLKDSDKEAFSKVGTILGKEWSKLSTEEKEKYKTLAQEETEARGVKKAEKVEKTKSEKPKKEKKIKTEKPKAEKVEKPKKEKKTKAEKHLCEHDGCDIGVKSEPVNGKYLCSTHKKKEEKKTEKKETKKTEKKENKKEKIDYDEEIEYDLDFFESEPISTDDDFWRGDNIKKVKGLDMWVQKESGVAFEIDNDGFYIFKGMVVNKKFIDHSEEDIPEIILDWVRSSDLGVASK
jgi:hypothetical protein